MNKKLNSKNGFIHLYNPEKEGLGSYDIHYMNAYKNNNKIRLQQNKRTQERYAA